VQALVHLIQSTILLLCRLQYNSVYAGSAMGCAGLTEEPKAAGACCGDEACRHSRRELLPLLPPPPAAARRCAAAALPRCQNCLDGLGQRRARTPAVQAVGGQGLPYQQQNASLAAESRLPELMTH
jgi:hypothetical protein